MENDALKKIVTQKFSTLPERLKSVLRSDHFSTVINEVVSRYNLDTNKAAKLDNATVFVMLGLTQPKDFVRKIGEALNTDAATSAAIAQQINERIFRPIREDLMKLYGLSDGDGSKKPLDVELEENVGLRKRFDEAKSEEQRSSSAGGDQKPLAAVLQDALRNHPSSAAPMNPPAPKPAPSMTPPPPVQIPPAMYAPNTPPMPPVTIAPVPKTPEPKVQWVQPMDQRTDVSPLPRTPQPPIHAPLSSPQTRENLWTTSEEEGATPKTLDDTEGLNREEILRGIEDPDKISEPSVPKVGVTRPREPGYRVDPYREPLDQ